MNRPFQGMCEFLSGLGECCRMFSVHACPSFQTNGFLCVCCLLLSAFSNRLRDLVLPGQRLVETAHLPSAAVGEHRASLSVPFFVSELGTCSFLGPSRLEGEARLPKGHGHWVVTSKLGARGLTKWLSHRLLGFNILPRDIFKYLRHLQGADRFPTGSVGDPYPWEQLLGPGRLRRSQKALNSHVWVDTLSPSVTLWPKTGWKCGDSENPGWRRQTEKRCVHCSKEENAKETQRQEVFAFTSNDENSSEQWESW